MYFKVGRHLIFVGFKYPYISLIILSIYRSVPGYSKCFCSFLLILLGIYNCIDSYWFFFSWNNWKGLNKTKFDVRDFMTYSTSNVKIVLTCLTKFVITCLKNTISWMSLYICIQEQLANPNWQKMWISENVIVRALFSWQQSYIFDFVDIINSWSLETITKLRTRFPRTCTRHSSYFRSDKVTMVML